MAPLNGPWDPLFCGEFNNVDRDRVCFMCPGLSGMNSNSLSLEPLEIIYFCVAAGIYSGSFVVNGECSVISITQYMACIDSITE